MTDRSDIGTTAPYLVIAGPVQQAAADGRITWIEAALWAVIKLWSHNEHGAAWATVEKLAERLHVSKRTVQSGLAKLEAEGFLVRDRRPGTSDLLTPVEGVQNLHGGGAKFAREGVQNLHPINTRDKTINLSPSEDDESRDSLVEQVVSIETRRRADKVKPLAFDPWARKVSAQIRTDDGTTIRRVIAQHPGSLAEDIHRLVFIGPTAKESNVVSLAVKDRSCEACHGTGWVIGMDSDEAVRCQCND